jgi:cation/acetate symporter
VLFIASPLRRFGEYTVADFAFGRFGTSRMRLLTVLAVLLVSLFYMAPQMFGAGTTWQVLVGAGLFGMDPYTTGVVVVAAIMMFYVAVGGMKGSSSGGCGSRCSSLWSSPSAVASATRMHWPDRAPRSSSASRR